MSLRKIVRYGTPVMVALVAGLMGAALVLGAAASWAQGTTEQGLVPVFDNVEDAEAAAGYKVFIPKFVPDGFQRGPIYVVTHMNATNDKSVLQTWSHNQEESFLMTEQNPGLSGGMAGDGDSTTVRGRPAELVIYPAVPPDKPFELASLSWRQQGMGFVVTSAAGSVTEELVKRVAESMEPS